MKPAIIMEMSCTSYVCGALQSELWPSEAERPLLVPESVSGFSAAHTSHFQAIASQNGGRMIAPVLSKNGVNLSEVSEVLLVGFSAGCWGVAQMLGDPDIGMVSAVMCVDGLHYPTGGKFEPFAQRAAAGEVMLVDLYSSIPVSGYTSTRDSARRIASAVGALSVAPMLDGADESWNVGSFYAVGFPGSDKQAHIDQVNTYQPEAWRQFVYPWLAGGSGSSGGSFPAVTPVSPPPASKPPEPASSPPVSPLPQVLSPQPASVLLPAFVLGALTYIAADRTWNMSDLFLKRLTQRKMF